MKRKIALLLAVIMIASLLPTSVFADSTNSLTYTASSSRGRTVLVEETAITGMTQSETDDARAYLKVMPRPVGASYGGDGVPYAQVAPVLTVEIRDNITTGQTFYVDLQGARWAMDKMSGLDGSYTWEGSIDADIDTIGGNTAWDLDKGEFFTQATLDGQIGDGAYLRYSSRDLLKADITGAPLLDAGVSGGKRAVELANGGSTSTNFAVNATAVPSEIAYVMHFVSDTRAVVTILESYLAASTTTNHPDNPRLVIPITAVVDQGAKAMITVSKDPNSNRSANVTSGSNDRSVAVGGPVNPTKPEIVKTELENILSGITQATTAQDIIVDILAALDFDDLRETMYDSDVLELLEQIEDLYIAKAGISTSYNISTDAGGFNIRNVNAVGMALNADSGASVSLTFKDPVDKINIVGPPHYNFNNAVQVDIDVEGIADSSNLDFPIAITVKIPTGISPNDFYIIHKKSNGVIDTIIPKLNGDGTCTFVVSSFSVFAFVNELPPAGNIDNKNNSFYIPPPYMPVYGPVPEKTAVIKEEPQSGGYSVLKPSRAAGTKLTAKPSKNTLILDNKEVLFPAVNIDGFNWLKLRDLALLLNGTSKQFGISYNNSTKTITITPGAPYNPVGDELAGFFSNDVTAIASLQKIVINGVQIDICAYNIDGYNYLRLRDLAILLDFNIIYNNAEGTVTLDLDNPYSE